MELAAARRTGRGLPRRSCRAPGPRLRRGPGAPARAPATRVHGDRSGAERLPRLRRLPAARRVRHLEPLRARAARRTPALDPHGDRRDRRGLGHRRAGRRGPQPRSGGAPRGVRRPARGGAYRLQRARRARCLLRHLGVRADAPCRAGCGPSTGGTWAAPRRRALRLRGHRRDVRAARRSGDADGRGAGRAHTYHRTYTAKDAPVHLGTTRRRCPTRRRSRRRWPG